MSSKFFTLIPPDLSPEEQAARRKRQQQAEWGVAVARLGGGEPSAYVLADLQRYIDGELTLAEVAEVTNRPSQLSPAYQALLTRAKLSE
ncbi:MAG TPA: antitoxin VbhA family protein [Hymenobacter sp.]|jgi:hypothetical protein